MDLVKIRAGKSLIEACPKWFAEHRRHCSELDQDFLNAFFRGSIKYLPRKFNDRSRVSGGGGVILHCARERKPWLGLRGHPAELTYWSLYLKSAWGEDKTAEDMIGVLSRAALSSPWIHRHTRQCWRNIAERLWRDVLLGNFLSGVWLLIKEAVYKAALNLKLKRG